MLNKIDFSTLAKKIPLQPLSMSSKLTYFLPRPDDRLSFNTMFGLEVISLTLALLARAI